MKATDFFFILSAIYITPHVDKKTARFLAIAFCVIGIFSKFADA